MRGGLFGAIVDAVEKKADGSRTYGTLELWRDIFGGQPSKSGVRVTWDRALKVTTALACVRRIAEGTSTVPCKLYRRKPGTKERDEARDHPLYELMATKPNDWQDSLQFRETKTFHTAVTGNGYSFINRNGAGRILELIPIDPGAMSVKQRADYTLDYKFRTPDGRIEPIDPKDVWHLRGPAWFNHAGMDAIALLREALGLAISLEESQAALHANGGRPGGFVSMKHQLGQEAITRTEAGLKMMKQGAIAVFDDDASFHDIAMSGVDAQHIETRRLQVEQICAGLGVLPIMVGQADKAATYASAEQMFLAHLVHTVRPWHERFQYSMDASLLTEAERRAGYYFGFVDQAFLRAAAKDRAEVNKAALGGGSSPGSRTINEVRGDDELPPIPGGDNIYVPLNAGPIGADGVPISANPAAGSAPPAPPPEPGE